jgi:hypothetical protein
MGAARVTCDESFELALITSGLDNSRIQGSAPQWSESNVSTTRLRRSKLVLLGYLKYHFFVVRLFNDAFLRKVGTAVAQHALPKLPSRHIQPAKRQVREDLDKKCAIAA